MTIWQFLNEFKLSEFWWTFLFFTVLFKFLFGSFK
jgi:hypothetical protein